MKGILYGSVWSQAICIEFVKGISNPIMYLLGSIDDVTKGFNSTIFAYGQTGSGKTYTMFGPHWEDSYGH